MTPVEVVEALYLARRARDIDAALALCSEAFVATVNANPDKPGSGITVVGRAANRQFLELVDDVWEPVSSSIGPLRVMELDDAGAGIKLATRIRVIVTFALRHRASNNVLEGTKTHEWTVRGGKLVSLCETLDREFISAFLRMSERDSRMAPATPDSVPDVASCEGPRPMSGE